VINITIPKQETYAHQCNELEKYHNFGDAFKDIENENHQCDKMDKEIDRRMRTGVNLELPHLKHIMKKHRPRFIRTKREIIFCCRCDCYHIDEVTRPANVFDMHSARRRAASLQMQAHMAKQQELARNRWCAKRAAERRQMMESTESPRRGWRDLPRYKGRNRQ